MVAAPFGYDSHSSTHGGLGGSGRVAAGLLYHPNERSKVVEREAQWSAGLPLRQTC